MNSNRRVMRTTAALVGMAAIGAVGTGTAFADTAATPDRAPDGMGHTDHTAAHDGLATTHQAHTVEHHSFQMPGTHHHDHSLAATGKKHFDNDHKRSHSGNRDHNDKHGHGNRSGKHRKY